ncbi:MULTISPECIES: MlaE family ABC transporter permease [Mesorhizobium]|uniref:ABC transporter permease n=1 Tax=Mesorhizobium denitrificans TaxID=2294114 RepID=A0A371XBP2_9HYPH|nr:MULTISPECIES: ABC transporter permease [Mesorhizobium]RFC66640.1 ABC transporter permease [Mesorhizobium denitrificans]
MLTKRRTNAPGRPEDGPVVASQQEGGVLSVQLTGIWSTRRVGKVDDQMRALQSTKGVERVEVDISSIGRIDTAGAWIVDRFTQAFRERKIEVSISGANKDDTILLDAVEPAAESKDDTKPEPKPFVLIRLLESIGRSVYSVRDDVTASLYILGATIRGGQMKAGRGQSINFTAIVHQIDRMGVGAIPVVVLMSAIVGAIIAQQGAFQLRYFGADIFVVDLVGILVLRELGVLMTAIMVAGRSGSAITAEIGSMKMREEVDALTVIGLNPVGVLVFPRLVALVISLPLLTIIANFAALAGAIFVGWAYVDIPPTAFIDRLRSAIDVSTIAVGLVKAPFMAIIIGILASVEGLKVGGSAESLGRQVTSSVVKSIFVVVIMDGLFAMFFATINF